MTPFNSKDAEASADRFLTNLREDVKRVIISKHVSVLRSYAKRTLMNGESLDADEERDRRIRVRELLTLGNSLKLTDCQIVTLLYRELL